MTRTGLRQREVAPQRIDAEELRRTIRVVRSHLRWVLNNGYWGEVEGLKLSLYSLEGWLLALKNQRAKDRKKR
jgi:hypothetical protein